MQPLEVRMACIFLTNHSSDYASKRPAPVVDPFTGEIRGVPQLTGGATESDQTYFD